jgi:hypothetical protein
MKITVEKMYGSLKECDCCGSYSAEGIFVLADKNIIWKKYSDGHMYGEQTEESILDSILTYWEEIQLNQINKESTEEARVDWNLNHPGNGIARTEESWKQYNQEKIDYLKESLSRVRESCKNLPYNEVLQVKMVALWLEECFGEEFAVSVSDISEKKAEKEYLA